MSEIPIFDETISFTKNNDIENKCFTLDFAKEKLALEFNEYVKNYLPIL